jgi:hypothetical protein
VTLAQVLTPKRPRNLQFTAAASVLMLLVWVVASRAAPWSPKRGAGLGFGILAAVLFVFEMLYPFRRPRARPLFTAQNWVQAHIYLGVVAFLAAVLHTDFTWPHGWMGWALLLLASWTTATGLIGVWLQKRIPARLSEGLRVEALYERIPSLVEQLRTEADALMEGTSDTLENFYRTQVRPTLARVKPSWSYFTDVRAGRERALERFRSVSPFVGEAEKQKVEDLMAVFTEKLELDAQYTMQGILRRWLAWTLHVPAAGLLIGLLAVHIVAWVVY